jgi:hypothetical protein
MIEELGAFLGDADRARGAVEQPHAQLVLKRLHAFGYRSWSEPQLRAHGGQVLHRGDAGKDTHVLNVHQIFLDRLDARSARRLQTRNLFFAGQPTVAVPAGTLVGRGPMSISCHLHQPP